MNGLWTAEFGSSAGIFGGGIVVFENGKIMGGDGGYFYLGEYELDGNSFHATIRVVPFIDGYESAFKTVGQSFTLDLQGSLTDENCARTKGLIERSLQDAGIRYQSVQARVKTKKKLEETYVSKNYQRLADVTDLAGLRVITYHEDEADRAAEVVKREFDIDFENSIDRRDTAPDRFGYHALNYVCKHLERRRSDVEYKTFAEICCEIQVTSILRHAWCEIEHDWYDLKDAYPDEIKRRFYRLAALLEIAESE